MRLRGDDPDTPRTSTAWVAAQQQPAAKPDLGADGRAGFELFTGKGGCIGCHTVVGIEGAVARVART